MRKPTLALSKLYRLSLLVATTALIAACAGESTAPATQRVAAPVEASKALSGIVDGVYTYTVNPNYDQVIRFGDSYLTLPANSICSLSSSYGPQYWNSPCTARVSTIVITATVRNANTNNPSVDFEPALRFNPNKTVRLTLDVTNAATMSNLTNLLYCGPFSTVCVNEAQNDGTLTTEIDKYRNTVSRRIKHFSGYVVAE